MKIENEWWTCTFYPFYNFRTSKDLEILRQSSYMSHILKGLSKRNTHIPHIVLYDEEKWQKMCSNAYFGFFRGGGHFWRVTRISLTNNLQALRGEPTELSDGNYHRNKTIQCWSNGITSLYQRYIVFPLRDTLPSKMDL